MGCRSSKEASLLAPGSDATIQSFVQQVPARKGDEKETTAAVDPAPKTLLTELYNSTLNNTNSKSLAFGELAAAGQHTTENQVSQTILTAECNWQSKWQSASTGNLNLVQRLKRAGTITSLSVERAMLATDRRDYVPSVEPRSRTKHSGDLDVVAYADEPQTIGLGATISAPHMHAHALELLALHLVPGARVLDIGSGSGYLSACMARMVGPTGMVIGVDHLVPLVDLAIANVSRSDPDLLENGYLTLLHGDGWKGCPDDGPFDCIHVGAAAEKLPQKLLGQLKSGGRMVIPVGTNSQYFYQIDRKLNGEIVEKKLMGVRYVPLVKVDVGAASVKMARKVQHKGSEQAALLPQHGDEKPPGAAPQESTKAAMPESTHTRGPDQALEILKVDGSALRTSGKQSDARDPPLFPSLGTSEPSVQHPEPLQETTTALPGTSCPLLLTLPGAPAGRRCKDLCC